MFYNSLQRMNKFERERTNIQCSAHSAGYFRLISCNSTLSAEQAAKTYFSVGIIKKIGICIYTDSLLLSPLASLELGMLDSDSRQYLIVYIRNEGNTTTTLVTHSTNWYPLNAESYLDLTLDYNGQLINPSDSSQLASS